MHQKGSLKEVMHVSWPLAMGMLSFTVMDLTDTLLVAQLGTTELAAVGMETSVMFLINSFFIGFFESVKIFVSQAVGANQLRIAKQGAFQGLYLAILAGLFILTLSFVDKEIFHIFGGPEHIQVLSAAYFKLRIWASPFWFITLVLASYYQGSGNTKLPMQINIFMCIFNAFAGQILIFGFGPVPAYGMDGSAYATVLADFLGMALMLGIFIYEVGLSFKPNPHMMTKLLALGFPVGVRWLLDSGGSTFVVAMIARLGEVPLAANQIATKIMSLSLLPVYGISEAACILTGQCTGAQDFPALKRSYWSAIQLAVLIMVFTGLIFVFVPTPLIALFQKDTEIIQLATQILISVGCYQILSAFSLVTAGALNGTGDTRFTMLLIFCSTWMVMVPFAYLFGKVFEMGVFGMWLSLILYEGALVIGTQWRFHSGRWKNHQAITIHP